MPAQRFRRGGQRPPGQRLRTALESYDAARALAASARALTLDAQATVYEMAGIVARLAA